MSILIDQTTRVIVQGYTGDKATFHAKEMIAYGTNVVGGVTPGKGGTRHLDRPVFNTVKEAVKDTGATASIVFVPAAFCADSIMEAAAAGIKLVVAITDGIPAQDMMMVKRYMLRFPKEKRTMLVGPNCAGVISPGKAMMGIMPGHIYMQGTVGVVTRSGGLGVMRQFVGSVRDESTVRDLLVPVAPPRVRDAANEMDAAELLMMQRDDERTQMRYAQAIADWGDAGGYDAEVVWDACTVAALGVPYDRAQYREVRTLSGGEQKRLVLEALLPDPRHRVRRRLDAADEHRRSHHQQDVAEDRAGDRRLHDLVEPLLEREERDDQLRRVAEGHVHDPADPGARLVRDLLGGAAHGRGGGDDAQRGGEEDQGR